jgi:hypothetical protein
MHGENLKLFATLFPTRKARTYVTEIMTLLKSEKYLFANKTSHSHMIHSFYPTVWPTFNMQCSLFKCLQEK